MMVDVERQEEWMPEVGRGHVVVRKTSVADMWRTGRPSLRWYICINQSRNSIQVPVSAVLPVSAVVPGSSEHVGAVTVSSEASRIRKCIVIAYGTSMCSGVQSHYS